MSSQGKGVPSPPRQQIHIPAGANIDAYLPKHLRAAPKEPLVSCPYDAFHRVKESRLRGHIIKCERTHPPLAICFYNATHRMPADQYPEHVKSCPSRLDVMPNGVVIREALWRKRPSGPPIPLDEDWD